MAKSAGVPRATWALLESGGANPTLSVLSAAAGALSVSLEELVGTPRASAKLFAQGSLPSRKRGAATVRSLLPDPLPGTQIERIELPRGARLVGVPHTPGTREYLTCEAGDIEVVASGETYRVAAGDVLVFRGDQRHSYVNAGQGTAVGYSVVLLRPPAA
jgi:quercetin dioxygenase-like cupin family protein